MNPTADILNKLFQVLNDSGIIYCVLRGYEKLPEQLGHDVDLWVRSDDEKQFQQLLVKIATDQGWELVRYAPWLSNRGQGRYFFVLPGKQLQAIHFDCYVSIYCKGISFMDIDALPQHIVFHEKGFYVPSLGVEAAMVLFKDLMHEGRVKQKYRDRIDVCRKKDYDCFAEILELMVGPDMGSRILQLVEQNAWPQVEQLRTKLRWTFLMRELKKRLLAQIYMMWRYLYTRLNEHFFENLGIFIVLIGPDGSGKTTIAKRLLESNYIIKLFLILRYFHGRFAYLPELKKIFSFITGNSHLQKTELEESPLFSPDKAGLLRAIMYPLYYGLDALLGHLRLRHVRAYYGFMVADRYFYDYFIQNRYSRCPRWLLHLIASFIPKPDLVIYLKNKPEIIHSRKNDLPLEEIQRQITVCSRVIKHLPNGVTVDTSDNADEVVRKIEHLILEKVKIKWERSPGFRHIHRSRSILNTP